MRDDDDLLPSLLRGLEFGFDPILSRGGREGKGGRDVREEETVHDEEGRALEGRQAVEAETEKEEREREGGM